MESVLAQVDIRRRDAEGEPQPAPFRDWRDGLPVLTGRRVILREVTRDDAASLVTMLAVADVVRFMAPLPATVEGFGAFIESAMRARADGRGASFALVPVGCTQAVGLIHITLGQPSGIAEWTFAISPQFWGSGVFQDAAEMVVGFVFAALGAHRLEARVAVCNGRGNGALSKLGAVQEGILRNALVRDGRRLDQVLWTILDDDWRCYRAMLPSVPRVH